MASPIYNKCKKIFCICQRYRPKENVSNECFYCNHSIGYHESTTIDITEYPFGQCKQIQCGCQRFKSQKSNPLLCVYCNHYDGFHSSWPLKSDNNLMFSTSSKANTITNTSRKRHFKHRVGRIPATILKINTIICLDKKIPNSIPKFGSPFWNYFNSRDMIKNDIKISNCSSFTEIYSLIFNLFSDHLNGQGWHLFNGSSGKLRKVMYNEITCDLIKQNLTKTKKLYIAPDTFDIGSNTAENLSSSILSKAPAEPLTNTRNDLVQITFGNNNSSERSINSTLQSVTLNSGFVNEWLAIPLEEIMNPTLY